MSDTYKICFLGYKKLGELAHQVIEHLNYSDTTIILKECSIETLVQAVNEAISEGCQVFVAGSANAEEFKRRFYEHLIELHIDMSDYLYCLQRAKELGAKKIARDGSPQKPEGGFRCTSEPHENSHPHHLLSK